MTLYLKYRPQKIDDLDLETVRESLKKIVQSKNIPHAFLFSGPKGTGKTSAARIIAKIVNCKNLSKSGEPCNRCEQCRLVTIRANVDVIELDAASHRGIDDIRSLRDAVKLAPAAASKKVYIIDEAHMLTLEASNALLKTLEEPPDHVMFILATTNPEKLIDTIRSRTTNIKFNNAKREEIVRSLKKKIRGEKLKADEKTLGLIAESARGSFRDADKLLEQLVAEKIRLNIKSVSAFLNRREPGEAEEFLKSLVEREAKTAIGIIEKIVDEGGSIVRFIEEVMKALRTSLLVSVGVKDGKVIHGLARDDCMSLMRLLDSAVGEVRSSIIEQIPLEIAVVEWCGRESQKSKIKSQDKEENANVINHKNSKKKVGKVDVEKGFKENLANFSDEGDFDEISNETWTKIIQLIKPKNFSTEALLRATRPIGYNGNTLKLGVYYKFHKERLEEHLHRSLLETSAEEIFGNPVRIICELTSQPVVSIKTKVDRPAKSDSGSSKEASAASDSVLTDTDDEDIIKIAKEIFEA